MAALTGAAAWGRPVVGRSIGTQHLGQLVIVRDPTRAMPDDFLFTSTLDGVPARVASPYAGCWSIERVNREVQRVIGAEGPQCWKRGDPERAASLSL